MNKISGLWIACCALAGCATTPDVALRYYPTTWGANVSVVRTVACDAAGTQLLITHAATVAPWFTADRDPAGVRQIELRRLRNLLSDTDVKVEFMPDGRLKSINQSASGQGEVFVKAAMSVLAMATASVALKPNASSSPAALSDGITQALREGDNTRATPAETAAACKIINAVGRDKPISLIYGTSIGPKRSAGVHPLEVRPEMKWLNEALEPVFAAPLMLTVTTADPKQDVDIHPVYTPPAGDDGLLLNMQKLRQLTLTIGYWSTTIATSTLRVPTAATYPLPIPKAPLFGKQTFALTVAEDGSISMLGYGTTSGAAAVLGAVDAALKPETASAKAAELKAEADLIAQQQRLAVCQTRPSDCSK